MDDEKLNHCRVVIEECFKLPVSTPLTNNVRLKSNITHRRQSFRLQDKILPCLKESPPQKRRRKMKKVSDDKVKKSLVLNVEPPNDQLSNDPPSNDLPSNDPPPNNELGLSDNDILKMLDDYDIYLENGSCDPTILTNIDEYDFQPIPDEATEASTASVANLNCDYGSAAFVPYPMSIQTLVKHTRSISTETEPPVLYSTSCQTDSVHRRSISTQTEPAQQRSESTQTYFENRNSMPTQTSGRNYKTEADSDSGLHVLKRKSSSGSVHPNHCKIIIKNYDLNNFSVSQGVSLQEIPKYSSNRNLISGEPKSALPKIPRSKSAGELRKDRYQTGTSQHLRPKNNFDLMKFEVLSLLQRPCSKFLKYEICDPHCRQNHFLPDAGHIAEAIKYWPDEQLQFLYITYVQRYKMCYLMYYKVLCTAWHERQSPQNIIATIKDCQRLSLESQFVVVLSALKKCGYTDDDALFEICTHADRSDNALNEILKMIVTFNVANFKRTIALLSSEIETTELDPYFGNEILKQAAEIQTLDVALVNFCYGIVRKYSCILNAQYMRSLLSRI